jgi:hypothetical protein
VRFGSLLAHVESAAYQIGAILFASNAQCERQLPGSGREILDPLGCRAPTPHSFNARERLECTDENASRLALLLSHEVQAFIHAVNEIDVRVSCGAEEHPCSIRNATPGMRRAVINAQVCFRFNDTACGTTVNQNLAEAVARHFYRGACVEIASQQPGMCFYFFGGKTH